MTVDTSGRPGPGAPTPPAASSGEITRPASGAICPLIEAVDWAATPLGPRPDWPPSLRTAVDICLASLVPMAIFWGPEFRLIYNDAYVPILGSKHPRSLGQPGRDCWAEIWPVIGPMLEQVRQAGAATFRADQPLTVQRAGYREEAYFTFSFSPIRACGGEVGGALCAVTETTGRVLAARRGATLQRLGAIRGAEASPAQACRAAMTVLAGNQADVPFALACLLTDDSGGTEMVSSGEFAAGPALTELVTDGPVSRHVCEVLETQQPQLITGLGQRPRAAAVGGPGGGPGGPGGAAAGPGDRGAALPDTALPDTALPDTALPDTALLLPLGAAGPQRPGGAAGGGRPAGVLCCAVSPHRLLDDDYRAFFDQVAGLLAALVADARSWAAQRARGQKLAELDRAKTAFFSNISHEFRTPLALIMGPLEELRTSLPADADLALAVELEVMHRNGLRLGKLVNTLLEFSRIEAGRARASYEPVNLAAMTADLASVFRAAVERAGLGYEVDCQALPEPVYLDREMWEKVVLNLLSNALKFTFDGSIRVSVHAEQGQAVLQVTDTGIGIPAHELPRLFERFHRIEQSRARSNDGSGIGLALVRDIVALHGGSIAAASTVDAGTTVTVRLRLGCAHLPADQLAARAAQAPVAAAGPPSVSAAAVPFIQEALSWPAAAGAAPPPDPADQAARAQSPGQTSGGALGSGRSRILIADDHADMRDYLKRLLSPRYLVLMATDGVSALAAARAEHPDLIISDVMMPEADGITLVGALRGSSATAAIPVLLLSARAGQDAIAEGLEAGADDYLPKPFSPRELLARIATNLELARLRGREAAFRRALMHSLQEGFFLADHNGVVTEVNDAFGDITGYGPEGAPYPLPYPWLPDAERDEENWKLHMRIVEEALREDGGQYTVPIRRRDGRLIWATATVRIIPAAHAGSKIRLGTLRDVTAEREAAEREAAVSRLAAELAAATDVAEVLSAALAQMRQAFDATRAVAAIWRWPGQVLVAGLPEAGGWAELDESARNGLEEARKWQLPHDPVEAGGHRGQAASVAAALAVGDAQAAVWLDRGASGRLDRRDLALFGVLCTHLEHALARALHYEQARDVALALQHAILGPLVLPAGFAVRYEPAVRPLEVGGDWYDVVALTGGRIGIVVGDCVGRGLEAAAVMGQLRSACRALLLRTAGPAQVLTDLDNFAHRIPGAVCTTVFCAIIDAVSATICYSSAGHPPAILAHPGSDDYALLDRAMSVPLAVLVGEDRPEATARLSQGASLLLYTDGLVERRGARLDEGISQAGRLLRRHLGCTPDELADRIMAGLAPAGGEDDVAVLTYRLPPRPLHLIVRADPTRLAGMRRRLQRWLTSAAVPPAVMGQVVVSVSEACANAIEHAYASDCAREVEVTARLDDRRIEIVIADTSTWKPSQAGRSDRGRGLTMMRAFMDEVHVDPSPSGSTVRMIKGF